MTDADDTRKTTQPPSGDQPVKSGAESGGGTPPPAAPRAHLTEIRIPRAWLLGMLTALAVLLVLATLGFAAVNDNRTCGGCHAIKAEVDSYGGTPHHAAGVGCQECHTKPGVFNYFVTNLARLTHIIETISGHYDRPVTSFVGADNCVRCHEKDEIERDVIVGNIRVNHKGLREGGYQCVTCHATVAHGDTIPTGARPEGSTMSICWQCHNGVDQSQRCSICHLNGVPPGSAQVRIPLHMDSGDCADCHDKSDCARCHNGLTLPHPSGWRGAHGKIVLDRGKSICAGCHTKEHPRFCTSCHGLELPHPSNWPERHGVVGGQDQQVCVKCHGRNSCATCHGLQMPHPANWQGQHGAVALSDPGVCATCHNSSGCVSCHGVELPHSAAFVDSHPDAAARWGAVCSQCHGNSNGGPGSCYSGECHASAP